MYDFTKNVIHEIIFCHILFNRNKITNIVLLKNQTRSSMIIEVVKKKEGNFQFEATNEQGNKAEMDGSPAIGGENKGVRPMEMLIMGLGGCSGIDILSILRKQKIEPLEFTMKIDAEREADVIPSLFRKIHINFYFKGVDKDKADRAIKLSLEKYCSVAKTLEATAEITYSLITE